MIFLSLIMDLLLSLGIGIGGVDATVVSSEHHYGTEGSRRAHTIHGHDTSVEHHGVHGHDVGPSGHENQNPHGTSAAPNRL